MAGKNKDVADTSVILARFEASERRREEATAARVAFETTVLGKLETIGVDVVEVKAQATKTNGRVSALEDRETFVRGEQAGRKGIWTAIVAAATLTGTIAGIVAIVAGR